jgi:hypothetical protein
MENTTYRVNVTSHGLSVYFRNRINRTPVVFESVYEPELKVLKLQLKQKSMDFIIEKNSEILDSRDQVADEVIEENNETEVEELYTKEENEPKSILDKLIADDK